MLLALIRKTFLTLITVFILSIISYNILLREPSQQIESGAVLSYWQYVEDLLQGDWGVSHSNGEPLVKQLLEVFPSSISLGIAAMVISLLLGVPLGFFAVAQRNNLLGKLLISFGSLSLAVPVFWLAILWLAYASLNGWEISAVGEIHPIYEVKPITGVTILDIFLSDSPYKLKMMQSALQHLALPTLILSIPATLEIMRITSERAEDVLKQNYVKVARARGWSPFKVWSNLVLRNTVAPLIPAIAHTFTLIFAFGLLIENIVSWGGIGRWLINALAVQDYTAISAGIMAIGLFVLSVDLLAEAMTTLLDPSQKKGWYDVK